MKNLKFLLVAVILTCFVGVVQSRAQAHIEKGTEYKPLIYEIDGETYGSWAWLNYQWEGTPSGNFNWVSHGELVDSYKWDNVFGWVHLDEIALPKRTVVAHDANNYYDEKVTINPKGKVTVVAHTKPEVPWW